MTRGRAPTLLLVGTIALTLSGCASYNGYASAPDNSHASDSVASACSPYDDDLGCDYGDLYGFYDYGGGRWPHDRWRLDDRRQGDYDANGHVMTYGFGHAGFGHGGFGHGGFAGGGHGR